LDFPDAPLDALKQIYQIAQVACAAAAQYRGKFGDWAPDPLSIPELPE